MLASHLSLKLDPLMVAKYLSLADTVLRNCGGTTVKAFAVHPKFLPRVEQVATVCYFVLKLHIKSDIMVAHSFCVCVCVCARARACMCVHM